jgi:hypothetical protein
MTIRRPFLKIDLHHENRPHPSAVLHLPEHENEVYWGSLLFDDPALLPRSQGLAGPDRLVNQSYERRGSLVRCLTLYSAAHEGKKGSEKKISTRRSYVWMFYNSEVENLISSRNPSVVLLVAKVKENPTDQQHDLRVYLTNELVDLSLP